MLTYYFTHFLGLLKFFIPVVLFSPFVFSQHWTGANGGNWNDPANWSDWPLNGENVVIDASLYSLPGNHPHILSNSVFAPANISVLNGAQLMVMADLMTVEDFEILDNGSQVTINAGNVSIGPGEGGRFIAEFGGALVINSGTVNVDERLIAGEDATITVNGGIVTTGERLILDLGGHFIQNAGIIQSGALLALADGNANGSCYFEKHGGALTVSGEMVFENEIGNYTPAFFMDGGTFNMNGHIIWFGEGAGSGRPKFEIAGGLLIVEGDIGNQATSTVNVDFEMRDSAVVYFEGSTVSLLFPGDSLKHYNNSNLHLYSVDFINDGVIHAQNSVVSASFTNTVIGSGKTTFHTLLIQPGSLFNNIGSNGINITGDLDNNGSMNNTVNVVRMTGDSLQAITGSVPTAFYDLLIDQETAAGINLYRDISISHHLELNSGILKSQMNSQVSLSDNATSTPGNANSFISGSVKKTGDDAFVFPVGKAGRWMRFGISPPSSAAAFVEVEYFYAPAENPDHVDFPLNAVSPFEYWSVETGSATGPVNVYLYWENAGQHGILSCDDLAVAEWNGVAWSAEPSTAAGICDGSGSGVIGSLSPTLLETAYAFGFTSNTTSQVLQVCAGDSIFVAGNYYEAPGNYVDVVDDSNGNDSIVLTHVDVLQPFIYNQSFLVCHGDGVQVGASYYSLPGLYSDTLTGSAGCDSIVVTTLNVLAPVDLSVQFSQGVLGANPIYDSYQWLDCDNAMNPVAGATEAVFVPESDGNYAVIIYNGTCGDTTACVNVAGLGLVQNENEKLIFYPNPTRGELQISRPFGGLMTVEIYDPSGKNVYREKLEQTGFIDLTGILETGVYTIFVMSEDGLKKTGRLVVVP